MVFSLLFVMLYQASEAWSPVYGHTFSLVVVHSDYNRVGRWQPVRNTNQCFLFYWYYDGVFWYLSMKNQINNVYI